VLTSAKHRAVGRVIGVATGPRPGRTGARILLVGRYQGTLQEVKWPAREVDHSVSEVKNE